MQANLSKFNNCGQGQEPTLICLHIQANSRLRWKGMRATNTPAYYVTKSIRALIFLQHRPQAFPQILDQGGSDKHFSWLTYGINYGLKKFYSTDPNRLKNLVVLGHSEGATTLSVATFSITTLSTMTLSIKENKT